MKKEDTARVCIGVYVLFVGAGRMIGVSVNSSSCIECWGNGSAAHSAMTLQLILFVSYYLSSAKFVKLWL